MFGIRENRKAFPQSRQTNFHIFLKENAAPASLLRKTDAAEMA